MGDSVGRESFSKIPDHEKTAELLRLTEVFHGIPGLMKKKREVEKKNERMMNIVIARTNARHGFLCVLFLLLMKPNMKPN